MSNRLAVFDCDGTLVDSQHSICSAMTMAFEGEKLVAPDRTTILSVVGLSLPLAIARLLPEAEADFHDHLSESYKRAFQQMRRDNAVSEPLYPGIAELIRQLDADGWLLGVATGKSDRGLALCLKHHGLHARFATLQTADGHPSKPHPSMIDAAMAEAGAAPETTLMIGDTSYDMAMACAARVTAIGVTWGYHEAEDLRRAGAHHIAETPGEILALIEAFA